MSEASKAMHAFRPHRLLQNGHAQTLFGALVRRVPRIPWRRERLELPDGDFVDLDHANAEAPRPEGGRAVLVHGLGGSSQAVYVRGLAAALLAAGWDVTALNLRGASGTPNRLPRTYHSGDTADLAFAAGHLREPAGPGGDATPPSPLVAVGFSLGGNALLKLMGETGSSAPFDAAVSVGAPLDLALTADRLARGLSRGYTAYLLAQLKLSLWKKRHLVAPLIDLKAAMTAADFRTWDERVTAPLNGFASADDYYRRSSARGYLGTIARPTLILHALDDPFMPPAVLPTPSELPACVTLEAASGGGHVGFAAHTEGSLAPTWYAESRALAHFQAHAR